MSERITVALLVAALAVGAQGCKRETRKFDQSPPASAAPMVRVSSLQPGGAVITDSTIGPYDSNAYAMSQGKQLFSAMNCVGCHSHGGGGMGPALMDSTWIYGSDASQIFASIVQGRPNGMPSFRGKLTNDQVWQLVAYVRSLSGLGRRDVRGGRDDAMYTQVVRAEYQEREAGQLDRPARFGNAMMLQQFPAAWTQHESVLRPSSVPAHSVYGLWEFMLWTSVIVYIAVIIAMLIAAARGHRRRETLEPSSESTARTAVTVCGAITIVILFGFLIYDFGVGSAVAAPLNSPTALRINLIGHQWWWEVQYVDTAPSRRLTTANEIHVPVGRPVVLTLTSHRRDPQLLDAESERQEGSHPGPRERRVVPGRYTRRVPRAVRRVLRAGAREDGTSGYRAATCGFRQMVRRAAHRRGRAVRLGSRIGEARLRERIVCDVSHHRWDRYRSRTRS